MGQRYADEGKYTINDFQCQDVVGCVCMLKDWISSCCVFGADYHNYFQSKLKGMGRCAVCAATQVQVCGESVGLPQLHLLVTWWSMSRLCGALGAAHHRVDELMALLFRSLHIGAGPGGVSTGTRPP